MRERVRIKTKRYPPRSIRALPPLSTTILPHRIPRKKAHRRPPTILPPPPIPLLPRLVNRRDIFVSEVYGGDGQVAREAVFAGSGGEDDGVFGFYPCEEDLFGRYGEALGDFVDGFVDGSVGH